MINESLRRFLHKCIFNVVSVAAIYNFLGFVFICIIYMRKDYERELTRDFAQMYISSIL